MNYEEPIRFKAEVYRSGCETMKIYGKGLEKLRVRAIRELTSWEPDFASTRPLSISFFRSVRTISGNRTSWEHVETIPYKLLRDDQHEWRKKKLARAAACATVPHE